MFAETTVQTCIVHLMRNSLDFASWKDRRSVAAALKGSIGHRRRKPPPCGARCVRYEPAGNELSPDCGTLAWARDQVPVHAALPGTIQPRSLNLNPPHTRNSRYLLIGRHEVFQLHRREQRFLHPSPTVMNDIANAPLATPVLTVEKFNSLLGSSLASATVAVLGYGLWARVPIIAARRDRDAVGRNESTTQSSAPVASMPVACRPGG